MLINKFCEPLFNAPNEFLYKMKKKKKITHKVKFVLKSLNDYSILSNNEQNICILILGIVTGSKLHVTSHI